MKKGGNASFHFGISILFVVFWYTVMTANQLYRFRLKNSLLPFASCRFMQCSIIKKKPNRFTISVLQILVPKAILFSCSLKANSNFSCF